MKRIAIIGAGMGGLVLANELAACAQVTVFEKARGVGGRMSTRYADPYYFDHGTQCFTARTIEFKAFLKPYMESGIVSEWKGKVINLEDGIKETKRMWFEPHLVASPNMNSLCKTLAKHVDVRAQCEVAPLTHKTDEQWQLEDTNRTALGKFDWMISTAPPIQTQRLFGTYLDSNEPLNKVSMQGCYALMIGLNQPWGRQWIAAKIHNNPLKWISVNSSKPGRARNITCLVAHSRNDWAESHINDDMETAQAFLLEQFTRVTGIDTVHADFISTHRWRYAIVDVTRKSSFYYNNALGIAATSDWCETSRIEEVWTHAHGLAQRLISEIKQQA